MEEDKVENIALFFCSIIGYFLLMSVFIDKCRIYKHPEAIKGYLGRIVILVILCAPFNINGSIYTIAGNAVGKNVYSAFSLYQRADNTAFTLSSLGGYQKAGKICLVGFGVTAYQEDMNSDENSMASGLVFGISVYQKGTNACVGIGVAGCQKANREALVLIGIAGYQEADRTVNLIGLTFAQKAKNKAYGLINLYQNSDNEALAGFAFYQRAGEEIRSFAIMSILEIPLEEEESLIRDENKK